MAPRAMIAVVVALLSGSIVGAAAPANAAPIDQGGGYSYEVQNDGVLYTSPQYGAHKVYAPYFDSLHRSYGGGTGALGYPIDDQVREAGNYWYQKFERGVVYASPYGTYAVLGDQYDATASDPVARWGADTFVGEHLYQGGGSRFGYPLGNRVQQGGTYFYQVFQGGVVYSHYDYELEGWLTLTVKGGFLPQHASFGGGTGRFGYPITEEEYAEGSWYQYFEGGAMEYYQGAWYYYSY